MHEASASCYKTALAVLKSCRGFPREDYDSAVQALTQAQGRLSSATQAAFSSEDIPAVLGDSWTAFIQAGEAYIREVGNEHYPRVNDQCIYCRQDLSDAAVALIAKYRNYCDNELRRAVSTAEGKVDKLAGDVVSLDLATFTRELEKREALFNEAQQKPVVLGKLKAALPSLTELQDRAKQRRSVGDAVSDGGIQEAAGLVEAEIRRLDAAIEGLTSSADERRRTLDEESAKLRNSEARIMLRELLPHVKHHVTGAKWADRGGTILGQFRGLSRSLTDAAKVASEQLLNQDFERRFRAECDALKAPKVNLEFPGRKGEAARRKSLSSQHKLSEILSEGEQKVIALADFLAEASMKKAAGPIVFDDPVTSLDYRRLTYVVDRIVGISRERQVIVFTHNIWFTTQLLARFERDRARCSYYGVSEGVGCFGIVTGGTHPRSDTITSLRPQINSVIQEAQRATGEAQAALIERGYGLIRAITEVIVEQDLLCSVTQRYQPNVMMTRLVDIKCDRLQDAIAVIFPIYEKACRYIPSHSQPLETLGVRPSVDELETDWKAIQDARGRYRA